MEYQLEKNGKKGKKILEMLVRRLILSDGTFSQYSLNYHRLMLDSLNCCEFLEEIQSDFFFRGFL